MRTRVKSSSTSPPASTAASRHAFNKYGRKSTVSCVIGLTTVASVAATGNIPDFATFVSPATPERKKPSKRWVIVSPSPTKKTARQSKNAYDSEDDITESFGAFTAANFTNLEDKNIEIHTLILGTHPSGKSLKQEEYYGNPVNVFWWIAGDCLGFRRASGVSSSSGEPYVFVPFLRHHNIIPYEHQVETLCRNGFALWDIINTCRRLGSLDQNIDKDVPNDIHEFCKKHPSIRRIVFANGLSASRFFKKHFAWWLDSGELVPSSDTVSQNVFSKWVGNSSGSLSPSRITLVSAIAVSSAAARYSYEEKRDFWDERVYTPGLVEHRKLKRKQQLWVDDSQG